MKKNVIIPRLGSSDESDEERTLRWIASPGASVKKGEARLEVETDKVNVEVEAPEDGTLGEFGAKFGAVIAVIEK
jgi:2-oxoglutarate dehydrogenase E2 component (dihydrolipoamide succinyltransferase)